MFSGISTLLLGPALQMQIMNMLVTIVVLLMCQLTTGDHTEDSFDYGSTFNVVDVTGFDWALTFPGTKWCGEGNNADSYDDLGLATKVDICCRAHDFCDEEINGGQTKYNLTNTKFYSKVNCTCDGLFYNCLKSVDSLLSNTIGYFYFNILGTQCFREDYPIIKCRKYNIILLAKKCVEYEYDTSKNKTYQWFDVPKY